MWIATLAPSDLHTTRDPIPERLWKEDTWVPSRPCPPPHRASEAWGRLLPALMPMERAFQSSHWREHLRTEEQSFTVSSGSVQSCCFHPLARHCLTLWTILQPTDTQTVIQKSTASDLGSRATSPNCQPRRTAISKLGAEGCGLLVGAMALRSTMDPHLTTHPSTCSCSLSASADSLVGEDSILGYLLVVTSMQNWNSTEARRLRRSPGQQGGHIGELQALAITKERQSILRSMASPRCGHGVGLGISN